MNKLINVDVVVTASIIIILSSIIFLSISINLSTLTITKPIFKNTSLNDIEASAQKDEAIPLIKYSHILDFHGENYADVVDSNDINLNSFTISLWFKSDMNVTGNDIAFLLNKGGLGTDRFGFNLNYGIWLDNKVRVNGGFEAITGEDYILTSQESYADGLWHNAILTFDAKLHLLRLYIDGLEVATNSTLIGITPDNTGIQTVRLGANSLVEKGQINGNYTGQLDDIQVWDFAFTNPQVTSLFNTESKISR